MNRRRSLSLAHVAVVLLTVLASSASAAITVALNGNTIAASGNLLVQTNGNVTAITVGTDQSVTFAGAVTLSSAVSQPVKTITFASSPYAVAATDYAILVDASGGAVTVNLPAVSASRKRILVVKAVNVSGGSVTVAANGGDTIDGQTTQVVSVRYTSMTAQAPDSGTDWAIE